VKKITGDGKKSVEHVNNFLAGTDEIPVFRHPRTSSPEDI